jgi:preprotein translocase subunit SecB
MSDVNQPAGNGGAPPNGAQAGPPLIVNVQYVKDLSFEVPGAPQIYATLRTPPVIGLNLDVQVRRLAEGQNAFEVALVIRAEGHEALGDGQPDTSKSSLFIAELSYGGVFTLNGIPEASVEPVLLVECPRLLFPYARNILADVTREGGFPPVMLQPIDFVALWQSRRAQQATNEGSAATN